MTIYKLLSTFRDDLKKEIKEDSKYSIQDQEQQTYLAENLLEHVEYLLDFDTTGAYAGEYHSPSEWIPED